jgi:hypothetical protein
MVGGAEHMRPLDRKWCVNYDNALATKDKSIITLDPYKGWALEFQVTAWRDQCQGEFRATRGIHLISEVFPFKKKETYMPGYGHALYKIENAIAKIG